MNEISGKKTERCKTVALLSICIAVSFIASRVNAQDTGEWEIFKYERYQKTLARHVDSLKTVFKHRWTLGASVGYLFIPGYLSAEEDKNTGVDLGESKASTRFSFEYFITQKTRTGFELGYKNAPQSRDISPNLGGGPGVNVEGGGGALVTLLMYIKKDILVLAEGEPGRQSKTGENINIPHLFVLTGAGATFTNLVRVHGNTQVAIRSSLYTQVPFTCEVGAGLFQRIDKVIGAELTLKYQFSTNYNPPIGSIKSYSGFSFALKLCVIGNGKFRKVKQQLASQ